MGIQRPTVDYQQVTEPSRFGITIDAARLTELQRQSSQREALHEQRLAKLKDLYLRQQISLDQHQQGHMLLESEEPKLSAADRQRKTEYLAMLDGRIEPGMLPRALELIDASQPGQARPTATAPTPVASRQPVPPALTPPASAPPVNSAVPSRIGDTITNSIGMKLTYIPAGEFVMGSPAGESHRDNDETQHWVRISNSFLMQTTEATQGQWQEVMANNPGSFKGDMNLPVENVSWNDATEFCRKLSAKEGREYRLPTESEWEYACRAGTTGSYGGTGRLHDMGWYVDNAGRRTHPVGRKQANAWGLYDMHGNVWEWCLDWYGEYPSRLAVDPLGVADGNTRVLRGGCWKFHPSNCLAATRHAILPDVSNDHLGFRVVLDLPE